MTKQKNWRPMVCVHREWCGNSLVFASKKEAEDSAIDLMMRWTLVTDHRADPTDQPVNYRWVDGKLERILTGAESIEKIK